MVTFFAIVVFLFEGSIRLLPSAIQELVSSSIINKLSALAGLLLVATGINLLGTKRLRVTNLPPALVVVVLLSLLTK
ncbi:MAG: DUF554 domain-containing protein [Chloroflexi bacterium]|nr:DUF554 domain-containing protein [Chloroflexota bacterium]